MSSSSSRSTSRSSERESAPRDDGPRATARIGCSGWEYDDWRGRVYEPGLARHRWLSQYATTFDTVEVNATFYRLPSPATVARWAEQVPATFLLTLKLGAFGTHRKHLREPEWWLPRFLERAEVLGPRLGPILVQLPPRWRADPGRLAAFLAIAPTRHRWAVELRDPDWVRPEVVDVLREHQAALVWHDLLPDQPLEETAPWTYVRFHGPRAAQEPYRGRYPRAALTRWAERLRAQVERGRDVYAYFNNDVEAAAWHDAVTLRGLVTRGPRPGRRSGGSPGPRSGP